MEITGKVTTTLFDSGAVEWINGSNLNSGPVTSGYLQVLNYLKVKKLDPNAILPERAHDGDLGFDLYALEDVTLVAGEVTKVRTGIACSFPYGYGALIMDRSSVATKQKVFKVAGVIDNQYTGEILVAMFNPGYPVIYKTTGGIISTQIKLSGDVKFSAGDKIAQMVLTPVASAIGIREVDELPTTVRGTGGFGSTGK